MSWSLFKTKMNVLTGPQHISTDQFARTIADAYHQSISLHFDSMTAGGKVINNAPKYPILYQQILGTCNANLNSHQDVDILKQIGPFLKNYWTGLVIIGPTGIVTVSGTGTWVNPKVAQNLNFQIILNAMIVSMRTHIMTLTGTYVSTTVPGVSGPWSGGSLVSLG